MFKVLELENFIFVLSAEVCCWNQSCKFYSRVVPTTSCFANSRMFSLKTSHNVVKCCWTKFENVGGQSFSHPPGNPNAEIILLFFTFQLLGEFYGRNDQRRLP